MRLLFKGGKVGGQETTSDLTRMDDMRFDLNRDSRHSSTVEVRGYQLASSSSTARIHGTCEWSPRGIKDLAITIFGVTTEFTVQLVCADRSAE